MPQLTTITKQAAKGAVAVKTTRLVGRGARRGVKGYAAWKGIKSLMPGGRRRRRRRIPALGLAIVGTAGAAAAAKAVSRRRHADAWGDTAPPPPAPEPRTDAGSAAAPLLVTPT
jgi:hypothetical protein